MIRVLYMAGFGCSIGAAAAMAIQARPYRHCRHCADPCRQIHYDPCPDCQENRP